MLFSHNTNNNLLISLRRWGIKKMCKDSKYLIVKLFIGRKKFEAFDDVDKAALFICKEVDRAAKSFWWKGSLQKVFYILRAGTSYTGVSLKQAGFLKNGKCFVKA